MRLQEEVCIGLPLGQSNQFIRQSPRSFKLTARLIVVPQPPGHGENLRRLPYLPAKLLRPEVGLSHFRRRRAFGGHQCRAKADAQIEFLPGALLCLVKSLDEVQPLDEMSDGLQIRRALFGPLAGLLPVIDRPIGKLRLGVMMGQPLDLFRQAVGKDRLDRLGDPAVECAPPILEDAPVDDLMGQGVLECVFPDRGRGGSRRGIRRSGGRPGRAADRPLVRRR